MKEWTVVDGVVALAVAPKTELLSLVDSQDALDEGISVDQDADLRASRHDLDAESGRELR